MTAVYAVLYTFDHMQCRIAQTAPKSYSKIVECVLARSKQTSDSRRTYASRWPDMSSAVGAGVKSAKLISLHHATLCCDTAEQRTETQDRKPLSSSQPNPANSNQEIDHKAWSE